MHQVELVRTNPATGENTYVALYLKLACATITQFTSLELEIAFMKEKIKENIAKYMRESRGWTFGHIEKLEIHLNMFKHLTWKCHTTITEARPKAIINVRNDDDRCFQWALLSALHYTEVDRKSKNRLTKCMSSALVSSTSTSFISQFPSNLICLWKICICKKVKHPVFFHVLKIKSCLNLWSCSFSMCIILFNNYH